MNGNASHIDLTFANIIKNAIEAIDGEGVITISSGCENGMIAIRITDTGKGILPEHLNTVFNPFFTTKSVGQGVGLGLTTALNIVKVHNGSISCESQPGSGATFIVSLPYEDKTV